MQSLSVLLWKFQIVQALAVALNINSVWSPVCSSHARTVSDKSVPVTFLTPEVPSFAAVGDL